MSAPVEARFERQLGFVSAAEQQRLAGCRLAVLGLGGVGGVAAELLARAGVGALSIADGDVFDDGNLNRQVGATSQTMGRPKVEVMAARLAEINPDLTVETLPPLGHARWRDACLADAAVVLLAADAPRAALSALRAARRHGAPLVEAVALPVVQVRAFDPAGPDPELGLVTQGRPLERFSDDQLSAALAAGPLAAWLDADGAPLALGPEMLLAMAQGRAARGFGPHTWLAGALAALEALKIVLGRGKVAWHPGRAALDPCLWRLFLAS